MTTVEELAAQVKDLQKSNPEVRDRWRGYCDLYNNGKLDPAKAPLDILRSFIELEEQGGADFTSVSEFEQLLVQVKAGQRSDPAWKDAWQQHCNMQGGIRDPSRHSEMSLRMFVKNMQARGGGNYLPGQVSPGQVKAESSSADTGTGIDTKATGAMTTAKTSMGGGMSSGMGKGMGGGKGCMGCMNPMAMMMMARMQQMMNGGWSDGGGGWGDDEGGEGGGGESDWNANGNWSESKSQSSREAIGNGEDLVGAAAVKFGQKHSENFKQVWGWYAATHGTGKTDPTMYDDEFIAGFFDHMAACCLGGGEEAAPAAKRPRLMDGNPYIN